MQNFDIDKTIESAVVALQSQLPEVADAPPKFFLQFGPGFCLDRLFDSTPAETFLHDLPGFPGHPTPDDILPKFRFGRVRGISVLAAQGHRHMGEGHGILPCILPAAIAWKLGATNHIFVDSGTSLRSELKTGRWMVLTDCINGYSFSPTDGFHHLFKNSYPDMTATFSQVQNSELINALSQTGISPRLGIFMGRPGFHTGTAAETAIARTCGADMLGHDLVLEAMFSHALGVQVSALALATTQWQEGQQPKFSRSEFLETCRLCSNDCIRGLAIGIQEISAPALAHVPLPNSTADEILSRPMIPPEERRSPLRAFLPKND